MPGNRSSQTDEELYRGKLQGNVIDANCRENRKTARSQRHSIVEFVLADDKHDSPAVGCDISPLSLIHRFAMC